MRLFPLFSTPSNNAKNLVSTGKRGSDAFILFKLLKASDDRHQKSFPARALRAVLEKPEKDRAAEEPETSASSGQTSDADDQTTSRLPNLMRRFRMEKTAYATKFFAAASIGKTPKTFGLCLEPLSRAE